MKKEVYECDSCGDIILHDADVYRLELKGAKTSQLDGAGSREYYQNVKKLGFCKRCAGQIKATLDRLDKRLSCEK